MTDARARAHRIFHILVADDDPAMRTMVRAMLGRDRRLHVVAEALNGADAVAIAGRSCPDAVVLGMQMPFMDGITAAGLIKHGCPRTAVVIFSAVTTPSLVQKAIDVGVDLYLSKTTRPSDLADAIHAVCTRTASPSHTA